ncbi:amino acid permease-domain-containing protein [Aspergillus spectabilis]
MSAEKKPEGTISEGKPDFEPTISVDVGETSHHGDLHRTFTPRQVHIISLGCNIGSGMFIGTGKALANGGPGNMILAYLAVCIGVWAHLQALAEMAIRVPASGNYIDYADRYPALALGAGLAEWLGWNAVFASEGAFFVVLVNYWVESAVPEAVLLSIFIVICLGVFFMPNTCFSWFQYFGFLVKVFLFIFNTIISLAIIGGAGSSGSVKYGSTWTDLPVFKNGFGGYASAALLAIWAIDEQIYMGVLGAGSVKLPGSPAHDCKNLRLPPGAAQLIEIVLTANPNADPQSRCPGLKTPTLSSTPSTEARKQGTLVDVLFGHVDPAARLPMTFPQSVKHNPAYPSFGKKDYTIMYCEGVFIGHRYYKAVDRNPIFYFGQGESYTTFEYSNLSIPELLNPDAASEIPISVSITNTGPRDGADVVQIYIGNLESSVLGPARERETFSMVYLASVEAKAVMVALDKYALSFWSARDSQWKAEAGEYVVILATSADPKDEVGRRSFRLPSSIY